MTGDEDASVAEKGRDRIRSDRQTEIRASKRWPRLAKTRCKGISYQGVMKKRLGAMRPCAVRSSHLHRAKFIPQLSVNRRTIVSQIPAMMLDLF